MTFPTREELQRKWEELKSVPDPEKLAKAREHIAYDLEAQYLFGGGDFTLRYTAFDYHKIFERKAFPILVEELRAAGWNAYHHEPTFPEDLDTLVIEVKPQGGDTDA